MSQAPSPPATIDKAALLAALYGYLGGRIDSVGRRSSLLMAFLASFLAFAATPVLREQGTTAGSKMQFALSHPSILIGLLGMLVLMISELARIKASDDLFTKIAFTDADLAALSETYTTSPIGSIFHELITNIRVVGGFVKKKVFMYNTGCALFVLSVGLFVFGL